MTFTLLEIIQMVLMGGVGLYLSYIALRVLSSAVFTSYFETKRKYGG